MACQKQTKRGGGGGSYIETNKTRFFLCTKSWPCKQKKEKQQQQEVFQIELTPDVRSSGL